MAWSGNRTKCECYSVIERDFFSGPASARIGGGAKDDDGQLFALPYWRRVWIIQEVAVGTQVTVLCGPHEIPWAHLAGAAKVLYSDTYYNESGTIGWHYAKIVSTFRQNYQTGGRISLLEAMAKTYKALSTDERDKVFALLGLCYDGNDLVPYPNYRQPIGEMLRDLTRAILKSRESLYLLRHKTFPPRELHGITSWTLDWLGLWSNPRELLYEYLKRQILCRQNSIRKIQTTKMFLEYVALFSEQSVKFSLQILVYEAWRDRHMRA